MYKSYDPQQQKYDDGKKVIVLVSGDKVQLFSVGRRFVDSALC